MILTKQSVRIKPTNPKVFRMLGGLTNQLVGEVVEISMPSPHAKDQRTRYWVRIGDKGDHYISCMEHELEVIA